MLHLQQSPWLYELELEKKRKPYAFDQSALQRDIVIIGGGIAGIMTAYYVLTYTNKNVLLLERTAIASGATGHNAGQIVSYFERPTSEIIEQYGQMLATEGQQAIHSAWDLLAEIRSKHSLKTPIAIFEGLSGCVSYQPTFIHLENRYYRPQIAHRNEFCFIAEDCPFLKKIPAKFADLYTIVPRKIIHDLLETKDTNYSVAFTSKKGCMNSAMFCEEIANYLLKDYPTRFQIGESASVSQLTLYEKHADVIVNNELRLQANRIVLCTNGFKNIEIINRAGKTISTQYHEVLRGKIGFMKAFTLRDEKKPIAISYYDSNDKPYFYLTRRPARFSKHSGYNLLAVGGPEHFIADKTVYRDDSIYPEDIEKKIDFFIYWTRINEFRTNYEHVFVWHGLMGYTRNGIRLIGPDKYNNVLMYNLGCNGVGILPSIYGGKKIARFLNNQVHKQSIFDPYI